MELDDVIEICKKCKYCSKVYFYNTEYLTCDKVWDSDDEYCEYMKYWE